MAALPPSLMLTSPQNSNTPSQAQPSEEHRAPPHHPRKNHRGGIKNRAWKERKALGPPTPHTPGSCISSVRSGERRKQGHRAGVKYRERRERKVRSGEAGGGGCFEHEDGGAGEGEALVYAPSLIYDSDEQEDSYEEEHEEEGSEATESRLENVEVEEFDRKAHTYTEEDNISYSGKEEEEGDILIASQENRSFGEKVRVAFVPVLNAQVPLPLGGRAPMVVDAGTTSKIGGRHDVKLLSLMRPKVL